MVLALVFTEVCLQNSEHNLNIVIEKYDMGINYSESKNHDPLWETPVSCFK